MLRKKILTPLYVALSVLVLFLALGFRFFSYSKTTKQVLLSGEREVKVNLDAGFGTVLLSKGKSQHVLNAEVDRGPQGDLSDCITYNVKDQIGYLDIKTDCDDEVNDDRDSGNKRRHSLHFSHSESSTWQLQFTDAVPISFDIELGLGKAELNFTDLAVKDLNLSTGASKVSVQFERPNKKIIEDVNIEAGLSKFRAEGLCNANFNHFKFQGGVGSYTLDFSGALDREVDADIELGLGSLTIVIPEEIGVKIYYEKNWFSHFGVDKADFSEREDNVYYSNNYRAAKGKMNMKIEAGLGNVSVRRE